MTDYLIFNSTFGLLKRRFPCLQLGLRVKVERSVTIVTACTVLHNFALRVGERDPPEVDPSVMGGGVMIYEDVPVAPQRAMAGGAATRTALINSHHFTRLVTLHFL